ncbi:RluA family pseudouridine synthase [Oribacterium asaccharolyticum]|uniref:RluA family pseudouridine synthase n=1 Tax=Oribacterium asaccharolyticum TaxID=1501332 RepID=UPI0028E2CEA0|nr:RluA family pseudouridine synthase [Oribacterium asaccharolyticum]
MDFTAKDFIISENEDFALVNKPVGMDSERAPGEGFFPVHRLDKVASGLLLYAKNPRSAKKLSEALQEGKIKKKYHIIVESACDSSKEEDEALSVKTNSTKNTGSSTAKRLPKEDSSEAKRLPKEGSFSDYLYKDTKKQKMFPVKKLRKGVKEAVLHYQVLKERDGLALVDVELETGRFHQIRAQFSAHGFPLFGDGKYGSRKKGNVALHCYTLSFPDPKSGEELHFEIKDRDEEPWRKFLKE